MYMYVWHKLYCISVVDGQSYMYIHVHTNAMYYMYVAHLLPHRLCYFIIVCTVEGRGGLTTYCTADCASFYHSLLVLWKLEVVELPEVSTTDCIMH